MKEIMTRAWEIAREAVKKFGGKVKEYIAQALRMAWAETKKVVKEVFDGCEYTTDKGCTYELKLWQNYGKSRIYVNYVKGGNLGWIDTISERPNKNHGILFEILDYVKENYIIPEV